MDKIINYIKDFHISKIGLTSVEALMVLGIILLLFMVINWLSIYLPTELMKTVKTIVKWITLLLAYGFLTLIIFNSILNNNYWNVVLIAIIIISSRLDRWINIYDGFIDRKIDKSNKK